MKDSSHGCTDSVKIALQVLTTWVNKVDNIRKTKSPEDKDHDCLIANDGSQSDNDQTSSPAKGSQSAKAKSSSPGTARSSNTGVDFTRDNVLITMTNDQYRSLVRRLLLHISRADLTSANTSMHSLFYIKEALSRENNLLTAAVLDTLIIDTTHLFLWGDWGEEQCATSPVDKHTKRLETAVFESLAAPNYPIMCKALISRDERAAETSQHGFELLDTFGTMCEHSGGAPQTGAIASLPCVTAHVLLTMYAAYAEVVPLVLNNCLGLPMILIGYELLQQLEMLKRIPVLHKLREVFGPSTLGDGSLSRFSSKWKSLLGSKPVCTKINGIARYAIPSVTDFTTAPDRITTAPSVLLAHPCGGFLDEPEFLKVKLPFVVAKFDDKKAVEACLTKGIGAPSSLHLLADLLAIFDEWLQEVPTGLINYVEVYSLCLETFARFDKKIVSLPRDPLPLRKTYRHNAVYSGVVAMSELLKKVDRLLKNNEKEVVVADEAVKQLAICYKGVWAHRDLFEKISLF
jgi:hypothetical protein